MATFVDIGEDDLLNVDFISRCEPLRPTKNSPEGVEFTMHKMDGTYETIRFDNIKKAKAARNIISGAARTPTVVTDMVDHSAKTNPEVIKK